MAGAAAKKVDAQSISDDAERRQMIEDLTKRKQLPDTSQGNVLPAEKMDMNTLRRYHRDMMNRRI